MPTDAHRDPTSEERDAAGAAMRRFIDEQNAVAPERRILITNPKFDGPIGQPQPPGEQPSEATAFSRCPACADHPRAVPVVSGKPTDEALAAKDRGELVLSGCLVTLGEAPARWACPACRRPLPDPVP